MRVFIAVELPGEIREALSGLQRELGPLTNSARWIAPDSIHITLKFIGEVSESKIDEIDRAIVSLSWKPFTVTVRNVGFFPANRSPRIFWAGMEAPMMARLAETLDARLERIGFEKEERAFRPHITLARARQLRIDSALVAASAKYVTHDFGSFTVDRFFLIQSTLRPEGAAYSKLKEYLFDQRSE
jgi:2'-5' RNA ligase